MQLPPSASGPDPRISSTSPVQPSPVLPSSNPNPGGVDESSEPNALPIQDRSQVGSHGEADFDPTAGEVIFETQVSPVPRETYINLRIRLNANPNVNYLELDRSDLNQGLSQHIAQFSQLLEANPELRERLSQSPIGQQLLNALDNASSGFLNTEDILNIQTFIVASGFDISHENSATGIDGDYGPRTHRGLQQAFEQLLTQPDTTFNQLEQLTIQTTEYANQRRRAYEDSGDAYVHGQSRVTHAPVSFDRTHQTGELGSTIATAARRNAHRMGSVGWCMKGVRLSLDSVSDQTGIRLRNSDGSTIGSAYRAADAIRRDYGDRFTEVSFDANDPQSMAQLRNLPQGAIVVWDRNPNPATHGRGGGWKHGHISIALGGGMEASDHIQQQITNRNGKYGGVSVFIPNN